MFFGVFFLCVLSHIFFNTAPRSPKVGKNVDKSLLIITVWSKFNHVVILCCLLQLNIVFCCFVVPNVTKQIFKY